MADKAEPSAPELSSLDPTPTATAPPAAPAKPPRPLSPMQQNKLALKEAFPSVEDNVIEAGLIAKIVDVAILLQPYPNILASRDRQQVPAQHQRTQGQGQGQGKEHSFIDGTFYLFLISPLLDDLPIIRDNFRKGWSTLVSKVKSKLDGEPEQPPPQPPRPGQYGYHQQTSRY